MTQMETKKSFLQKLRETWKRNPLLSTGMVLLLMVILQSLTLGFDQGSFGEWFTAWGKNWLNILRNNATVGIVALGMTFVIISGGIDLAVGSELVAVGAILMVLVNKADNGVLLNLGITGVPAFIISILAAVLAGAAIGSFNGAMVSKTKIPPFIVTLGTMKICRSVTQYFMQSYSTQLPSAFRAITQWGIGSKWIEGDPWFNGRASGGEVILPIVYWFALAIIMHIVATRTPFGRQIFAIGSNEKTARLSGIPVDRVKFLVYVLMGVLVALTSVVSIARIGSMDYANTGTGYEMDAIAAVVIGGTSMSGGKGSIIGTMMGVLILGVMSNLLNLINVNAFLVSAFKGAIVICAVLLQRKR